MSGAVQVGESMSHWRAIDKTNQEMTNISVRIASLEVKVDALIRVGWLIFSAFIVLCVGAFARTILIGG